jgi:hypothetical protein
MAKPRGKLVKFLNQVRIRLHALVVLIIVAWALYASVSYLVRSVFWPTHVPERFLQWQDQLKADDLLHENAIGLTSTAPRAPLGHYHGVNRWFQPDTHNGCTISGCHSPMPHKQNKGVRAFDNFHATFLACTLCHEAGDVRPLPAVWIGTDSGLPQEAPVILQLMRYLELNSQLIKTNPNQAHTAILELLKQTLEIIGSDPLLDYLLVQLETSEPGSPVWMHALEQLNSELPQHARGEYGAKLASDKNYLQRSKKLTTQAEQYFAAQDDTDQKNRNLHDIHAQLQEKPHKCLACHGDKPALLDFEALGYTPNRTTFLRDSPLARQMQLIQQGQQFHLAPHPGGPR